MIECVLDLIVKFDFSLLREILTLNLKLNKKTRDIRDCNIWTFIILPHL